VRVCFKDLGVIFDPELSFSQHCKEKINKACAMSGIIKRNFIYLSEEAFVSLYKTIDLIWNMQILSGIGWD